MNMPKHDDLVDLAAAALLQAEALEQQFSSRFDGALDPRRNATLLSRLAAASQRRTIFARDTRTDLDTLIAVVSARVDEETTVHKWKELPEGSTSGELYECSKTIRTPEAEKLSADLHRLRNLRDGIAQVCALVDAEDAVHRMTQVGR